MTPSPAPSARTSVGLLFATGLLAGVGGCGWPRYSNLPDDSNVLDAADEPRGEVPVTFRTSTEDELTPGGLDNADPRNVTVVELASLEGIAVTGSLRGVGWNDTFEPPALEGEGCSPASRDAGATGDWAGDVDFVVLEVTEPGQVLCAELALTSADLGWDLLLYPLDESNCGLPQAPVAGPDGEPLGLTRGGSSGGWQVPVEPGRYGLLIAGYSAPDALATYSYRAGASLVPGGDGRELCPLLPTQGAN